MKTPVREPRLIRTTASVLLGIAAAVVCFAQLWQAARGLTWSPTLVAATGAISLLVAGCLIFRFPIEPSDSPTRTTAAHRGRGVLAFGLWVVWWAAVCVLVAAGFNWWRGTNKPLEPEAVRGAILGATIWLVLVASRRNWLRGVLFDPQKSQESKKRQEELARRREEMLAAARQGSTN